MPSERSQFRRWAVNRLRPSSETSACPPIRPPSRSGARSMSKSVAATPSGLLQNLMSILIFYFGYPRCENDKGGIFILFLLFEIYLVLLLFLGVLSREGLLEPSVPCKEIPLPSCGWEELKIMPCREEDWMVYLSEWGPKACSVSFPRFFYVDCFWVFSSVCRYMHYALPWFVDRSMGLWPTWYFYCLDKDYDPHDNFITWMIINSQSAYSL